MLVCLCRGVSDHTVTAAISAGADSLEQVQAACGAGGDCRACCDLIESLVERTRERHYSGAAAIH
ncbi:MAG TPA: (2Fe-2S)-binding protein [Methylomirabilota bacterium]|nr:(2Fe-2S)-binding protein [Methylomirabilota bacterium]